MMSAPYEARGNDPELQGAGTLPDLINLPLSAAANPRCYMQY